MLREIVLVVHNIRSAHNVGSLIRTSEALGVAEIIFSGYSPYPKMKKDNRLPHIANKIDRQINKTALDAQNNIKWSFTENDINNTIDKLRSNKYAIVGLEQDKKSVNLSNFKPPEKIALIIGNEVNGIETNVLKKCDSVIEIPMPGQKESLNVVQATAIALFRLGFLP
jgi:23S rRNA (guanosine2251-2'-O)-methyltransferase